MDTMNKLLGEIWILEADTKSKSETISSKKKELREMIDDYQKIHRSIAVSQWLTPEMCRWLNNIPPWGSVKKFG